MLFNANAKAIVWHTPCLSSWQKNLPKCKSLVFTSGWLIFFLVEIQPSIVRPLRPTLPTIDGSIHHHMWWTPRSSNCCLVMWLTYDPCLLLSFAQLHCNFLHLSNWRRTGKSITIVAQHWKRVSLPKVSSLPFCISPHSFDYNDIAIFNYNDVNHLRLQQQHCHHHMFSLHI